MTSFTLPKILVGALIAAGLISTAAASEYHFRVYAKGVVSEAPLSELTAPTFGEWAFPALTFGADSFAVSPPASTSSGAMSYSSSDPSVATLNQGVVTIVGAGTTIISAAQAPSGPYASGSISAVLSVLKGTPVLGTYMLSSKPLGTAPYLLPEPSASVPGGSYSYLSSNPAVAKVDDGWITLLGAGTTSITATRAGDRNYNPVSVTANLTVAPAPGPQNTKWNPDDTGSQLVIVSPLVLSGGRFGNNQNWQTARANVGKSTGKFMFAMKNNSNGDSPSCGLANSTASLTGQLGKSGIAIAFAHGQRINSGIAMVSGIGGSCYAGITIAVDLDEGKGWISEDGRWLNKGDPANGLNPAFTFPKNTMLYPAASLPSAYPYTATANFGTSAFSVAVPAGFTPGWY